MVAEALARLYNLSRTQQRILALLVALALAICVGLVVVNAASLIAGTYQQLQDRRAYLGNLQLMVAAAKEVKISAADPASTIEADFFGGDNREVISAQIQSWLGSAAASAGAQLQSIEIVQLGVADEPNAISLATSIVGTWRSVQNVILQVETARPMLFVKSADIQSMSYGDEATEPQVSIRLVFSGLMKTPVQKDKSG